LNREILYRGKWIKDDSKWVEGFYYKMSETTYAFKEDYEMHPVPVHHYILDETMTDWGLPNQMLRYEVEGDTVCQYTGLKDSFGIRIYEGDIGIIYRNKKYYYAKVIYEDAQFKCVWKEEDTYYKRCLWIEAKRKDFTIISNIVDNPKLLNKIIK
jgi:hypothetical protein